MKIYNEKSKKETLLKLNESGLDDGNIDLIVVDEHGDWITTICVIQNNGTIRLCPGVDKDCGIQLDDNRKIIIKTE